MKNLADDDKVKMNALYTEAIFTYSNEHEGDFHNS